MDGASKRTIRDFGDQWTRYPDNDGFYGSPELLADVLGPTFDVSKLRGLSVADIGAGTGRIVGILLEAGVRKVVALEPSEAFEVLRRRFHDDSRVTCLKLTGDQLPADDYDLVVSIGVLHHVPDPVPIIQAAWRALRPGGRCVVWVYGREGNESYLRIVGPLRKMTTRLPHAGLAILSRLLHLILLIYARLERLLTGSIALPLHDYLAMFRRLGPASQRLVIYDQLNPTYSKYYSREEADALMRTCFQAVELYHRRRYSWTIVGFKPSADPAGLTGG